MQLSDTISPMSGKNYAKAPTRFPLQPGPPAGPGAWLTPSFFARSLNAMLIADDDRVYVDCNQAAEALLDSPRDRIIGARVEDFAAIDLRAQVPAAWAAFLKAGSQEGLWEFARDGKRIHVEYSATANVAPGQHLSILMPVTEPLVLPVAGEDPPTKPLSAREREILTRIALGASGQKIATELSIAPETVRTHLRNILLKLGAQTRSHAVALGLQRGEIMPEPETASDPLP